MFAFFEKGAFIHGRREEEERKIYEFVNEYAEQNKVYPSYREIAKGIGFSCASCVYPYIKRVAENGKVDVNGRRGVSTEKQRMDIVRVPVIGYVACGSPVLTEECIDGYIPLRREDLGFGKFFALYVSGRSMIGVGIEDGDLVIVRRQETVEPGQIVVALVGNEVTLKRYYPKPQSGLARLHPENKRMKDIIVKDCQIQGIAVKVLKNLQ